MAKAVSGCVPMTSELVLRFNYGQAIPWVTRTESGICAVAGPDTVWLHAETKHEGKHLETVSRFEVKEGQEDGLVMRYNPVESKDGLVGGEGMFLACSFWLVSSLCLIGRAGYARMLFEHLLSLANDLGLLSEEYDTKPKRLIGNFPQAFSHIALISAAYHLLSPLVTSEQES